MIFSDSLAMRTITFLALGVKSITVIDPRAQNSDLYAKIDYYYKHYDAAMLLGTDLNTMSGMEVDKSVSVTLRSNVPEYHGNYGMSIDNNSEPLSSNMCLKVNENGINLTGWALDDLADAPLSGLFVKVGDTFVKCDYGIERSDMLGERLTNIGFSVKIPSMILEGLSEISFIQVSSDRSHIFEPVVYKLVKS
jgi:hypothetical protein